MDPELNAESIGHELGAEGVRSVVAKVEAYCGYEEQRIRLTNEPKILALQAEIALLQGEERHIEERLRQAPPSGDLRTRRRKKHYYWAVTVTLAVAAFVFSLLAFEPFRQGAKSYLYCLGIAIVTPFLIEEVIERGKREQLIRNLVTVAFVSAMLGLVCLAVIRGDLLAEQWKTTQSPIVIDDATPTELPAETTFYANALPLLSFTMVLLAIAMELGAGLALHNAWRMTSETGDDWTVARNELRQVRGQMAALLREMKGLQNAPAIFVARFWRTFYRAMLTHTMRSAMTKILLTAMVIALPFFTQSASAEERVTIIAAIDLSQSVGGAGPDRRTDFEKNVEGVTRLLLQVPVSSRVVVLGITDKSFAQPYILLSAHVSDDPGYFGERLQAARAELVRQWRRRSKDLRPQFPYTDIVGMLLVANQIFDRSPKASQKILILFSDMRHHTPDLDLESGRAVPGLAQLAGRSKSIPRAMLQDVEVYALGVDGTGKSTSYWQSLKAFWREYFENAEAVLREYSVLRDMPKLAPAANPAKF